MADDSVEVMERDKETVFKIIYIYNILLCR